MLKSCCRLTGEFIPIISDTFLSLYQVVGVAQAINKKSGSGGTFTEKDEKVPECVSGVISLLAG